MRLRLSAPDGSTSEQEVHAANVRFGRDPACEVVFDPQRFPQVSGQHARIDQTDKGPILTPLSRSNKTLLNDHPLAGPVPVAVGDRIRLGFSGPSIEILALAAHRPADHGATVAAAPQHLALLRGSRGTERMEVGTGGVIGREAGRVTFVLDHPHVSRRHARLLVEGTQVQLLDLGSANGTFVNGRRLGQRVVLRRGDRIDIGPFSLTFDGTALLSRSRENNIELLARGLRRVVKDRATGKALTLLDDIDLVVRPREFVCLLGPSGSGKSTLLAMLSGRAAPDEGSVCVNGQDLYENFAALKQDLAVVPQKDVLHDALSVGTALRYTAELRLPPDTRRAEIDDSVADLLAVVGLTKRQGTLLRHLSGGQVKRASLANELMARPSLLFLDEVTSGLDEQTDRDMMELFRQVAEGGKTVVCITHSLANVEATCHLVVILAEGGRLAFVGTPEEARSYFGIARLGDVYRKLAERPAPRWQTDFRVSPYHARYVRDRLPAPSATAAPTESGVRAEQPRAVNPLRQAWILMRRHVAVLCGDPLALVTLLGQALLVAVLLGAVFGHIARTDNPAERVRKTVNLLFLLNVSCFWFGCNNAAKELVKERVIYARERAFNLRIDSYFVSKLSVLVLIAVLQVSLLFGIVRAWCDPPGAAVAQWGTLVLLATAGTALGLLISAAADTEEVALALVPVAVLPQIIVAGVIAPLQGVMEGLASWLITSYRGAQALDALLPDLDRSLLKGEAPAYGRQLAVVGAHIVAFAALALLALSRGDRTKR